MYHNFVSGHHDFLQTEPKKKKQNKQNSGSICQFRESVQVISNELREHPSVEYITKEIINDTLRAAKVPDLWRVACLTEFIVSEPELIETLATQPSVNARTEHAILINIEKKLDRTDLVSRDETLNTSESWQKKSLVQHSDVETLNDTYHVFSNVEFSKSEEDDDVCSSSKKSKCKSGVCFSWKNRARTRLNKYTTEAPPLQCVDAFDSVVIKAKYGSNTVEIKCKQDKRLSSVNLNDLDVPSVWIPSIRKQNGNQEKYHCLNLTHTNQMGQCDKYAVVIVVRHTELKWYYDNFYNANTYFVAIDREQKGLMKNPFCVGDAKNFAFLMAKNLGCERMVLMDDGVHGFEHNSIISLDKQGIFHSGMDRDGIIDRAGFKLIDEDNQRFPITWSTTFHVMSETMDITGAALIASDTKPREQTGDHCSEFINRYSVSGKLPNQVWMLDVSKITSQLNNGLPTKHHIASPLHPGYQAGEDVLMNMVLFQRGLRVETLTSIRHRKWAGGTCSRNNGESWNPFLPIVKYRDIYRMVDVDSLYSQDESKVHCVANSKPKRDCVGKGVQKLDQPVPKPETLSTHIFEHNGKELLKWNTKQPLTNSSDLKKDTKEYFDSVEVDGRTNRPNEPVISCQRNGHPKFNVLKQKFKLKGYGLRWWHTLVSLDALNKHLAGGVQYTKLRKKTKAITKTTRKGKRSTRKRTKNVPLNIGGTKGKTY